MGKKTNERIKFLTWLDSMFPSKRIKNKIKVIEKRHSKKIKEQKRILRSMRGE